MSFKTRITKIKRSLNRLNGCTIMYDCTSYKPLVETINTAASSLQSLSDVDLLNLSMSLRQRAGTGANLDTLLVDSFALVKEAIIRVLKLHPFDEQLIAAIVLHHGKIAEMQTGEGKTLAAVFPAYLNALSGKGVHILTFNDYLAKRDAQWMGPVYRFLGLSIANVQERMSIDDRKQAYNADITYVTAKESGFDYLRDSQCYSIANQVHRSFHYAIIDEADSILIDEARIPLIIAGIYDNEDTKTPGHVITEYDAAHIAADLHENSDFTFDTYARNISLTDKGLKRVEDRLQLHDLYAKENSLTLARLYYALHAQNLLFRDKDYIVRNGKVELVDDFTGRIADKRRWPDGLQAAVEAKEACAVQEKGTILNSIPLQHFLQKYPKLCGMTATAQQSEEEFREFYNLHIVVIPQHKQCARNDLPDSIYRTKTEKQTALIQEIVLIHQTGRPVLVGTQTVEESFDLAAKLKEQELSCEILNAKRDAFEAGIISQAGRLGALTIATNMAGRGTDIQLGGSDEEEKENVVSLGGLYVIGTNRHDSKRVDNQLKGRAGRQGDPGCSRFIISLEDDLCKKYKLNELIPRTVLQGNDCNNPIIRSELNRLQRIIEGQHLEIKKALCRYTFLIEKQRKILFQKRHEALSGNMLLDFFKTHAQEQFTKLYAIVGENALLDSCKKIYLSHLDKAWSLYLGEMDEIRECIHLRVYGKQDPLFEYNKCAIDLFNTLLTNLDSTVIDSFNALSFTNGTISFPPDSNKAPTATWTYLVNDNPFEDQFSMNLFGNSGLSAWAGLLWPLTGLLVWANKMKAHKMEK